MGSRSRSTKKRNMKRGTMGERDLDLQECNRDKLWCLSR
jgi:hypothetical protein